MDNSILERALNRVAAEMALDQSKPGEITLTKTDCCGDSCNDIGVTEFVGTGIGDTIGLLIASIDPVLGKAMDLGDYRSIGVIGSRSGVGPQAMAVDDAVKATNAELIRVEVTTDDKGGAGQGCLIFIGADDVSDARRAVEIALESLSTYFGDVYYNDCGHLEFQYTARASSCLQKAYGAQYGKAFGLVCTGPAAIGAVLSDVAVKAANVEIMSYISPETGSGSSFSNEITTTFTGDAGAVRQAVKAAIEVGIKLLGAMGETPKSASTPYI
ncbi:MAG: propanediol utilization microcompartment protein PduB [Clostridiales Family XIII bacterium]|jgi:microcompartment protein PduB|nr:propanediol utilization microcompartment protein PduB [Clostridiales Family XIII bacterium]